MLEFWNKLSLKQKLIGGFVVFLLLFSVFSYASGTWSKVEDWWFDKKIEKIEKENLQLQNDINVLKAENEQLKKERIRMDAQLEIAKNDTKQSKTEVFKEQQNLENVLKSMDETEKETAQPISNYERCLRINSKISTPLDCNKYKE